VIEEWRRVETKTGIISRPDLAVNGFRHVEMLSAESAFWMVCESLKDVSMCDGDGEDPIDDRDNGRGGIIVAIVICSILLTFAGIYCYKKVIQREITNDMTSKVN
jgi:hypothetical protein